MLRTFIATTSKDISSKIEEFVVRVPAASLGLESNGKNNIDVEIAAVAFDSHGKDVPRFFQTVQVTLNPDVFANVLKGLRCLENGPGT